MRARGRSLAILLAPPLLLGLAIPAPEADAAARPDPVLPESYYHYSLAQQFLLDRDYLHALEQMERAVATDTSTPLLMELAQLRFSLNDLKGATDLAERIAATHPELGDAHRLLGDIHLSQARDGGSAAAEVTFAIEQYQAALRLKPDDLDACRSLAQLQYHLGQLKEAGETLEAFAPHRPLDGSLSLLLGKVYARTGRYEAAETLLRQVVARAPGNLEAADALASLLEFEKKYDDAIGVYAAILSDDTDSAYLRTRLGTLRLLADHPKDAIADLLRAESLDPGDTRSLLPLAQAYEAADDIPHALEIYESLIQKEPANLEARFHRARLRQKDASPAEALKGYQEIIDFANGRGAVTDREASILALAYSQSGLLELDTHQYAAAIDSFTKALNNADDPGPELFLLLGRAELAAGKNDEAKRVGGEASKRFPADLDVRVYEGEVLVATGDPGGARDFYRSLLRDTSGSKEAYGRIAEALLRQKSYEMADTFLKEGTRQHPQDDGLLFARGAALERQGRTAEAERLMNRAIQVNPKNAMALNYLGYMLADRGIRLREAIGYLQRALAIDPRNAAYLDSLGWAQFRMTLYDDAEKNLRAALASDADDPTIREHLGDLLMQTGRADEALRGRARPRATQDREGPHDASRDAMRGGLLRRTRLAPALAALALWSCGGAHPPSMNAASPGGAIGYRALFRGAWQRPEGKSHFRLGVAIQPPEKVRLEFFGPVGGPGLIVALRPEETIALLPSERAYQSTASAADTVETGRPMCRPDVVKVDIVTRPAATFGRTLAWYQVSCPPGDFRYQARCEERGGDLISASLREAISGAIILEAEYGGYDKGSGPRWPHQMRLRLPGKGTTVELSAVEGPWPGETPEALFAPEVPEGFVNRPLALFPAGPN